MTSSNRGAFFGKSGLVETFMHHSVHGISTEITFYIIKRTRSLRELATVRLLKSGKKDDDDDYARSMCKTTPS